MRQVAKCECARWPNSLRPNTTIQSLENGQLLTSVILKINDTILESIITVDSSKRMNLQIGEVVTILIKASNLSIGEVLND